MLRFPPPITNNYFAKTDEGDEFVLVDVLCVEEFVQILISFNHSDS